MEQKWNTTQGGFMTVLPIRPFQGDDLVTTYLVYLQQAGYASGTIDTRLRLLGKFPRPPQEMTADDVVGMLDANLSPSSRRVYLGCLRSVFRDLGTLGVVSHDPTGAVRLGRGGRSQPKPLAPSQVDLILGANRDCREFAWSVLGMYAGFRASDVIGLYPEDLVETHTGWAVQMDGKGNVRAQVPAHPLVVEVIRAQGPRGPFWRITSDAMSRAWAAWALRLGLGTVRFHQLRHTFATRLYSATGDLLLVRDAMRHSSVAATQVYAQMDSRRTSEAISRL
jgi:integrase